VIRHEDERAVISEMLFANDLEPAIRPEQSANDEGDERSHSVNQHVGLPGKIPEPFGQGLVEIGGRLVLPAFHRSLE
jgi:hypothetical protein